MVLVDIITGAFAAILLTLLGAWVYAVVWMVASIVREETE